MSRSIFTCRAGSIGSLHCVYKEPIVDSDTGKVDLVTCNCTLNKKRIKDDYVLYPEHDPDTGEVVHNNISSDPIPVGVDVIYESTSSHDHGLSYISGRNLRCYETDHPEYHITEVNRPVTTGSLGIEQIGEVFGDSEPTLVSQSWLNQRIIAIPRIEYCNKAIYGQYNATEQRIVAKCMKDYTNLIKDWTNFSIYNFATRGKRRFFICEEEPETVFAYLSKYFNNKPTLVKNLMEIIHGIASKKAYVNLHEILLAHGVKPDPASSFLRTISTKTKKNLYDNTINLPNYVLFYKHTFERYGRGDMGKIMRANIINFMLNCPSIQVNPYDYPKERFLPPNRYWLIEAPFRWAYKEGIINKSKIPKWFETQVSFRIKSKKTFLFKKKPIVFSEELPDELKSDISEAQYLGKTDLVYKYPAMKRIRDIIGLSGDLSELQKKRFATFSKILRTGLKWSEVEIKECWKEFNNAASSGCPKLFWNWITKIIESDYIEANETVKDDGNLSPGRQFAINLFDAKIDNNTFDVRKPEFMNRWYITSGHSNLGGTYEEGGRSNDYVYNAFWNKLWLTGGIGKDRNRFKEEVRKLFDIIAEKDPSLQDIASTEAGLDLDVEDFEVLTAIDPNRDDVTIYEGDI